jgi:hypothetical protein
LTIAAARLTDPVSASAPINALCRSGVHPSCRYLRGTGVNSGIGGRASAAISVRFCMISPPVCQTGQDMTWWWNVGKEFVYVMFYFVMLMPHF